MNQDERIAELEAQVADLVQALVTSGEVGRCVLHANTIIEKMKKSKPQRELVEELCATIAHAANRLRGT